MGQNGHGCEATGVIGFTRSTLCDLIRKKGDATVSPEGMVPMPMYIFGNCCHIEDKRTGELRGDELVEYAVKLVKEQQVTKRPENILKDEHHMLSLSKTHSKNFGGRPLALQAAKNLKKVAKALLLKSYGLKTEGNTIGSVFMSRQLIKDQDKSLRREIGEFSNDFPGTLRSCLIDGGGSDIKDNDSMSSNILLFNKK